MISLANYQLYIGEHTTGSVNCNADEFLCGFNTLTRPQTVRSACLANSSLCDGKNDCGDYSDEYNCFSGTNQYACYYDDGAGTVYNPGTNVPVSSTCDGVNDCLATTTQVRFRDELGCTDGTTTCTNSEFACRDTTGTIVQCLDYDTYVCNGQNDCGQYGGANPWHYQDEAGCSSTCSKSEYLCPTSGTCVKADESGTTKVCDGVNDCEDMADELGCNSNCGVTEFYCGGTNCTSHVCDGNNNCGELFPYKDEIGCYNSGTECGGTSDKSLFQCVTDNTICLAESDLCDSENDCDDHSDEKNCESNCGLTQFTCDTTLTSGWICLNNDSLCDGLANCNSSSAGNYNDELGCSTCGVTQFRCSDNTCVTGVCNGVKNCPFLEDEANCDDSCQSDEYVCPVTGRCVQLDVPYALSASIASKVCDWSNDCGNYQDEYQCDAECSSASPFKCGNSSTIKASGSQWCVASASICDQKNDCGPTYAYSDEDGCYESITELCNLGEFLCFDKTQPCLAKTKVCDGNNDCMDYSDEGYCDASCDSDSYHCSVSGTCVSIGAYSVVASPTGYTCDGVNDCGSGNDHYSDELNCVVSCVGYYCGTTTNCLNDTTKICDGYNDCGAYEEEKGCHASCSKTEYRCLDDSNCVPTAKICDGVNDCGDMSDELNCARDSTGWDTCTDSRKFYCGTFGGCIDYTSLVCNGKNDCGGRDDEEYEDEIGCPGIQTCSSLQFACADNTTCKASSTVCDGLNDCNDYSDEEGCTIAPAAVCTNEQFYCSGTAGTFAYDSCIGAYHSSSAAQTCDGVNTCGGSGFQDELGCKDATSDCSTSEWLCRRTSTCVDISTANYFCDGVNDCGDYTDEDWCDNSCTSTEYKCPSAAKCVNITGSDPGTVCDGTNDCTDYSDELGCVLRPNSCTKTQYDCGALGAAGDATCVEQSLTCNGDNDCFYTNSYSDEKGCGTCDTTQFKCKRTVPDQCVDATSALCDSINDCHDFSDEQKCEFATCGSNKDHYHCNNGSNTCVATSDLCDGLKDCEYGEDEYGCFIGASTSDFCGSDEFYCGLGATGTLPTASASGCVNTDKLCDGYNDCSQFGDELNCDTVLSNSCTDTQYLCRISNQCVNGDHSDTSVLCDGNNDCGYFEDEMGCTTACNIYQLTCANGNCVDTGLDGSSADRRCDTFNDCGDYTDELLCDNLISPNLTVDTYTCTGSGNEFQCWDGTCVARAKLCDRNYDCPSYDDELNCEAFDLTNACTSNTDFACFDNTDCIVYTKLCDGVNDCADGSDENGCNPPANAATCPGVSSYSASSGSPLHKIDIGPNTDGYGPWLSCDLDFTMTNDLCFQFLSFSLQEPDTKTEQCRDYITVENAAGTKIINESCGTTNPQSSVFNVGENRTIFRFRSDLNVYSTGISLWVFDCYQSPEQISGANFSVYENSATGTAVRSSHPLDTLPNLNTYLSPKWGIVSPVSGIPFVMGTVNAVSGTLLVGTETQLLDYELQKEWVIQVGVFTAFTPYNGYKLITVRVLNVDEAPSFYRMPTTITINEDLPIESFIFTLRASDPDADDTQDDLIFEMVTSTSDFGVTQSGYVYTNITLDYETVTSHGPFNFKVCDVDDNVTLCDSSFSLTINIRNVNDNPPQLSSASYSALVTSLDGVGSVLTVTPPVSATDVDADGTAGNQERVQFRIIGSGLIDIVSIDPEDGAVRLSRDLTLSDKGKVLVVAIVAYDTMPCPEDTADAISTFTITIGDGSLYAPTCSISSDSLIFDETQVAFSTFVADLAAVFDCTDEDGDLLTFTIITGNGLFEVEVIDAQELHWKAATAFDFDALFSSAFFTFEVSDGACTSGTDCPIVSLTMIVRPANDMRRDFNYVSTSVTVSEHATVGTALFDNQISTCLDSDGGVSDHAVCYFSIVTVQPASFESHFNIDPMSGDISLAHPLNLESLPGDSSIRIRVTVQNFGEDQSQITKTTGGVALSLTVSDVNEFDPLERSHALYTTVQQSDVNVVVYTFNLLDRDISGPSVTFSTTSTDYTVGTTNGQVRVTDKSAMPLDAFNCPTDDVVYVTADPGGGATVLQMTLYVEAVPEDLNIPVFDPTLADFGPFIEKADPVGTTIGTVRVKDLDCGLYGAEGTRFEVKNVNSNQDCCIIVRGAAVNGFVTADIKLKTQLDYNDMGAALPLEITAFSVRDPLNTAIQVSDTINVLITDTKDYYPKCTKAFTAYVAETPAIAGYVVTSIDCDTTGSPAYVYSLTDATFEMNGADVQIKTTGSLDYETTPEYDITVDVEVTASSFIQEVFVKIYVQPINEDAPVWSGSATITELESVLVGTVLGIYSVADSDTGGHGIDPGTIRLADNFGGTFELFVEKATVLGTSYDVQLILAKPLDAETIASYGLVLTASDPATTQTYPVALTVTDVPEFPPSCAESAILVSIAEPVLPTTVLTSALNCDANDQGETVTYTRLSGDARFSVSSTTGVVSLISNSLDYEASTEYNIQISASDGSGVVRTVYVTIEVIPVNDNSPTFATANLSPITLSESTELGTLVVTVAASDSDVDNANTQHSYLIYQICNNVEAQELFHIVAEGPERGELYLTSELDYEKMTEITFEVCATNPSEPTSANPTATQTLTVSVTNVNDNAPNCVSCPVAVNVDENAGTVTSVDLGCSDPDGDAFSYSFSVGTYLSQTGGKLVIQSMNYESLPVHSATITVSDGTFSVNCDVIVTVNPVDEQLPTCVSPAYTASIDENTLSVSSIVQVQAQDSVDLTNIHGISPDSDTYSMTTHTKIFRIDSQTGVITNLVKLNAEDITSYEFDVIAVDGAGNAATCSVTISVDDVNDNYPKFSQDSYTVTAYDSTSTASLATISATDKDSGTNGQIRYSLVNDFSSVFSIDAVTGVISMTQQDFDNVAVAKVYNLEVVATDQSLTPLATTVNVGVALEPLNEFTPQFLGIPYTETIAEDTSIGTVLGTLVSATDDDSATTGDGVIEYYIDPPNKYFEISSTGQIVLTAKLNYDEMIPPYQIVLPIYAQDMGMNPGKKVVTTDYTVTVTNVNDIYPTCDDDHIVVFVFDDPSITSGTLATLSCSDSETGSTIGYAIASVNGNAAYSGSPSFALSANQLQFSSGPFVYTTLNYYDVMIEITDQAVNALSVTVEVSIYVNKTISADPVFTPSSYSFTVNENQNPGTLVGDVTTTTEGTNIVYTLLNSSDFSIDPTNGQIFTAKSLDYEQTNSYTVTVRAIVDEDGGVATGLNGYSDASVLISVNDLNDNTPVFASSSYSVTVSETSTASVAIVTSDSDGTGVNNVVVVSIDPSYNGGADSASFVYSSGSFDVNGNAGLDYDAGTRNFEIRLLAIDSGTPTLTGTATVNVQVVPANEFTPVWTSGTTFTVSETAAVGTTIGTATATDSDSGDTGDGTLRYTLSPASSLFSIGYTTGIIKTKDLYNFETTTSYSLTVKVSDLGTPQSSTTELITITVTDENDEQMTCGSTKESFFFQLAETTSTSGTIGTITCNGQDTTALFNDIGLSSTVISPSVSWLSASIASPIVTISFTGPIDYESLTDHLYTLTLNLHDNDGNAGTSSTLEVFVDIEITNVNEATPSLTNLPTTINIDETVSVTTSVFNATATDSDSGIFGDLAFYFSSGSDDGHFEINELSGEITVGAALDYETNTTYSLEVKVVDGGGLAASAVLTVNVNDINDHALVCDPSGEIINVQENVTHSDGALFTITCTDQDTGIDTFANRVYSLVSQTPTSDFEFDPLNRNELQVKPASTLDYEATDNYTLVVQVTDSGSVHTATISLTIFLEPVNEFDPVFGSPTYSCNINEDAIVGEDVCSVSATDQDLGLDGMVQFSITSGNNLGKFEIDSLTGQITVLNTIDVDSFTPLTDPKVFQIEVTAHDQSETSARSAIASVTVNVADVIDSSPECDSYITVEISELQSVPFNITDLDSICSDADASEPPFESYVIFSGNENGKFQISGSILQLKNDLDYESETFYNLNLRVCDHQPSENCADINAYVKVLPENECIPQFTLPASGVFELNLNEDTPIGPTNFILTASDCDNPDQDHGRFFFEMVSAINDSSQVFSVDKKSGEIMLGSRLDYDSGPQSYRFEVRVFDSIKNATVSLSSEINVTINVLDVNDNRPIFNPATYTVSVIDNVAIGTVLSTVSASDSDSDNNADITYEMTSYDYESLFYMNGRFLTLSEQLDADVQSSYKLIISATDNAAQGYRLSTTALVSIYVTKRNDERPEIVRDNGTIISFPEDTAIGTLLTQVDVDDDDGLTSNFEFTLVSVITSRVNFVDPQYHLVKTTGELFLASGFDYEDGTTDQLLISVTDGTNFDGLRLTVEVTNVNEHAPFCHSSLLSIPVDENSPKSVITNLEQNNYVSDLDYQADGVLNALKFNLLYASAEDVFAIDPFSGASGNTADNGRLELIAPILDFESDTTQYSLIFEVSDEDYSPNALTSTCNLRLIVQDVNDNAPEFKPATLFVNVTEQTVFSEVLQVSDKDAASSITGCSTNHPDFSVVVATKTLQFELAASVFTREYLGILDQSTLELEVYCNDGGTPQLTGTQTVSLHLADVDNNPPVFPSATIQVDVPECSELAVPAFYAAATDIDENENAQIVYTIQATSTDFAFASDWSIDSNGGWSPVNQLDYDAGKRVYEFLVNANGVLDATKTDSTNLEVTITNCNDNAPFYAGTTNLYFSIAEGQYNTPTTVVPTSPLGGLAAVQDVDSSTFIFQIIQGSEFSVNELTGELLTAQTNYDSENIAEYNLTVRVSDIDSPPLYVDVFCVITVADQNEFDPVCGANPYTATVSEDANVNTSVITVTATDADQSQSVAFSIKKQVYRNDTNPSVETSISSFTIDASSGVVAVGSALDYERGTTVVLDVCATDTGSPSTKSTTCTVTLKIIDVNDNSPIWINTRSANFYSSAYSCDTTDLGIYPLTTVEAMDADDSSTDFGTITYAFVQSEDMFELDQVTGYVFLKVDITLECYRSYVMDIRAYDSGTPSNEAQCKVRIDTFPSSQHSVKIGLNLAVERFEADDRNFLDSCTLFIRTNTPYTTGYCGYLNPTRFTSPTARSKRSLISDTEVELYVVANDDASTAADLDSVMQFLHQDELYNILAQNGNGDPKQTFIDSYTYTSPVGETSNPIYYIARSTSPVEESSSRWIETAGGIAVVVICSIIGFILFMAAAIYATYAVIRWIQSREVRGPDLEARRNWKKAIRKAMLISRLATAKAIDPTTGRVYVYNKMTKSTRWLQTVTGEKVRTQMGYGVSEIDDPNPTKADSQPERIA